jgi:membrane-associated phospholipid phosphatase
MGGVDSTDVRPSPPLTAAPERPLLSPAVRLWAAWVLLACAVIVAVLGVLFAHQTRANAFDRAVEAPIIDAFRGHHFTAYWLTRPGSELPALLMLAAIVVVCLLAGRLSGALLAVLGFALSEGLAEEVLKPLFHRTYHGSPVYPSGHMTAIAALAATVTVLLLLPPQPARGTVLRHLVLATAYALVVVVPLGLLALRWHYFTDLVGGAALSVGTVVAVAFLLDMPLVRGWLARPSRWLRVVTACRGFASARRGRS